MTEIKQTLAAAMFDVQQKVDTIAKKDEADAGSYKYKYAGMPQIWEAIKPLLKEQQLLVMQSPTTSDGSVSGDYLETTITFIPTGESITRTMRLVSSRQDPQGMGAAITYARRYMLSAMFGLITEDDNDARDHRLATAEQKKDWVRAFTVVSKKANPDANPTYNDFAKFLLEVYGKGINEVLAKDSQSVLDTINAFNS